MPKKPKKVKKVKSNGSSKIMNLPDCNVCDNRRYLICHLNGSDFLVVERCDNCVEGIISDAEAAKLAQKDGVQCIDTPPFYLSGRQDISDWC